MADIIRIKSESPVSAARVPANRLQKQEQQKDKAAALVKELAAMRKKRANYETTIDILNGRLTTFKAGRTRQAEQIKALQDQLQDYNQLVQDLTSEHEKDVAMYHDAVKEYEETHSMLCGTQKTLDEVLEERNKARDGRDKARDERNKALRDLRVVKKDNSDLQAELFSTQQDVGDLRATVRQLQAQVVREGKVAVKAALTEVQQLVAGVKRKA